MKRANLAVIVIFATVLGGHAGEPKASRTLVIDLPSALRLAGAQNLDIRMARARLAEAEAARESAVENFFPWIAPGVAYRRHDNLIQDTGGAILDVHKQSYTAGGTITAQTDLGEAIFKALEARQLAKAADHAVVAQRQTSILEAAQGYFNLVRAHAAIGVAAEALRLAVDYENELGRAVKIGVAFKGDDLRVKVERQRDEVALEQAREASHIASAQLVRTLHLDPAVELLPREEQPLPLSLVSADMPINTLLGQAYAARPEIRQSASLLAAARDAKNGATYGPLVPTIAGQSFFGGLGGGQGNATGRLGESEDYGVALGWRIGRGGLFDFGRIHGEKARLQNAVIAAGKVRDEIAEQVVTSRARVQSLATQLGIVRQSLDDARSALRLTMERKEFGVGAVLETILAEQDLFRTRNDYLRAVSDYNSAQYELLRALGHVSGAPAGR